jgi:hypothetical protein
MRAWPLHLVFATILVGSLAAKERTADLLVEADDVGGETAIVQVARSQGLALLGVTTIGGARALVFEAPGCSSAVLVTELPVTLEYQTVLPLAREQGVLRYVYIDRSWHEADRLALYLERMKYAVLKTFGLTRYHPAALLLLVESESRCEIVDAIDWRNVWSRDYIGAARADGGAATEATGR